MDGVESPNTHMPSNPNLSIMLVITRMRLSSGTSVELCASFSSQLDAHKLLEGEPPDVLLLALGVAELARKVDEQEEGGQEHAPHADDGGDAEPVCVVQLVVRRVQLGVVAHARALQRLVNEPKVRQV
eukprot:CAMPEP_0202861318 /NCGR_PEP_ID=MMETSP1391-20130828/2760_1 /ASSEMBLY_ACC=CAM_ASM_000867 /TAXON_ID=1034604 /ORGANISM="Chlamydomonas leiostraca, Strain SAG 11-49" /LENGTH=127 /DNA_ID=CAMNT_0049540687 /DNA_START=153 /DNA_END=538 /DNA_ORIENTATION=+